MQQQRQFREQIKQQHRQRLQHLGLGLGFCDDNAARMQKVEAAYRHVRGVWELEASSYAPVIARAVDASTTDNEQQTIDNTLANDRHFWSSTGSLTQVADEALLYELEGAASQVAFVQMAVYRAFYQHGYPVYPPLQLQIWLGPTPSSLIPGSPLLDVQSTDALQTFALYTDAPVAKCLQIRMYGKQQKQHPDMQFYIAIRHVRAVGQTFTAPQLAYCKGLLRSGVLQLSHGGGLPGSCASALGNACEHAVGLQDAAVVAAAARLLELPQQQQQKQQEQAAMKGVEELIVRQQQTSIMQQQQQRRNESTSQQQQQQRSTGSGGLWSTFGRNFLRSRDSSMKPNSSNAGDSSHEAIAAAAAAVAQRSEFDSSSSRSSGATPRWLPPTSAAGICSSADARWHQGSAGPQELQQQPQQQRRRRQHQLVSNSEEGPETDDASDEEADDEFDDRQDQDRLNAPGLIAQRDQFEFMLMQAFQRVDDPNQLEQVLAAWLQDDPLASTVPDTLRQQHIGQQPGDAGSSKAAEQKAYHTWGMPAAPAALVVGVQRDIRESSNSGVSNMDWQHQEQLELASDGLVAATSDSTAAAVGLDVSYNLSCKVDLHADLLLTLPGLTAAGAGDAFSRSAAVAAAMTAIAHGGSPQQAAVAAASSQIRAMQAVSLSLPANQLFRVVDSSLSAGDVSYSQQHGTSWFEEGKEEDSWLHQQAVAV